MKDLSKGRLNEKVSGGALNLGIVVVGRLYMLRGWNLQGR